MGLFVRLKDTLHGNIKAYTLETNIIKLTQATI